MKQLIHIAILSGVVSAGAMAHDDIFVSFENGRIQTGAIDIDDMKVTPNVTVFEGEFGELFPNFSDDPGFYTNVLDPGTTIGFRLLGPTLKWNGSDFDTIADETISLSTGFGVPGAPVVTTPGAIGQVVDGFNFAVADGAGFFDEHVEMMLGGPASDGVYLFAMYLTTTTPGILPSKPLLFIMGQNVDEEVHEAAVAFAEANKVLLPSPGAAALLSAACLGGALRRRR